MARLLTEQEVYSIGGSGSYTTNLLCTYARAQAMGCVPNGTSLASNQLVWEGSVKKYQCSGCLRSVYQSTWWGSWNDWYNDCNYTISLRRTTPGGSVSYVSAGPGWSETGQTASFACT